MFKLYFNKYLLSSILLATITVSSYCASDAYENRYIRAIKTAMAQGNCLRVDELLYMALENNDDVAVQWAAPQIGSDANRIRVFLEATITLNKPALAKLILNSVPEEIKKSVVDGPLPILGLVPNLSASSTPLHLAAELGHCDVIVELLAHGANPNLQNSNGRTPLHTATIKRQYVTLLELLKHEADPNVQDQWGNTPLHYAYNGLIFAKKLILHGADKHIENNDHQTYTELKRTHLEQKQIELEASPANAILRRIYDTGMLKKG